MRDLDDIIDRCSRPVQISDQTRASMVLDGLARGIRHRSVEAILPVRRTERGIALVMPGQITRGMQAIAERINEEVLRLGRRFFSATEPRPECPECDDHRRCDEHLTSDLDVRIAEVRR